MEPMSASAASVTVADPLPIPKTLPADIDCLRRMAYSTVRGIDLPQVRGETCNDLFRNTADVLPKRSWIEFPGYHRDDCQTFPCIAIIPR
jgi:hypothetical protein